MVDELKPDVITTTSKAEPPQCLSMAWSADGQTFNLLKLTKGNY